VELDAVVLLLAREMGIDVRELAGQAYQNLLARAGDQSKVCDGDAKGITQ